MAAIVNLYERNAGSITEIPGLSIAHKLKYEHINFSKMRVDLATQVRLGLGYKYVHHPVCYEYKCSKGTETDWWRKQLISFLTA